MYIYKDEIRAAARVVIDGGIGFVPLPHHCERAAATALQELTKLGNLRKRRGTAWDDSVWGYAPDDMNHYDRGLSEWRSDERKDVFHYCPEVPQELARLGAPIQNLNRLFFPCQKVYAAVEEVGLLFVAEFDRILPGYDFEQTCKAGVYRNNLRLLSYEPRKEGETAAAKAHYDRSFISLHTSESAPGLFIGPGATRISTPSGHMAVFAGRKFTQMTGGKVRALYHGTVEVPDMEPNGRRASVFFLHSNTDLIREEHEIARLKERA